MTIKKGGISVSLTVPISFADGQVDTIDIGPVQLDHTIRWSEGKVSGALPLLAELSGLPEAALRLISYPDVARLMGAFMVLLPGEILNDINAGVARTAAPAPHLRMPDETDDDTGLDMSNG